MIVVIIYTGYWWSDQQKEGYKMLYIGHKRRKNSSLLRGTDGRNIEKKDLFSGGQVIISLNGI